MQMADVSVGVFGGLMDNFFRLMLLTVKSALAFTDRLVQENVQVYMYAAIQAFLGSFSLGLTPPQQ